MRSPFIPPHSRVHPTSMCDRRGLMANLNKYDINSPPLPLHRTDRCRRRVTGRPDAVTWIRKRKEKWLTQTISVRIESLAYILLLRYILSTGQRMGEGGSQKGCENTHDADYTWISIALISSSKSILYIADFHTYFRWLVAERDVSFIRECRWTRRWKHLRLIEHLHAFFLVWFN